MLFFKIILFHLFFLIYRFIVLILHSALYLLLLYASAIQYSVIIVGRVKIIDLSIESGLWAKSVMPLIANIFCKLYTKVPVLVKSSLSICVSPVTNLHNASLEFFDNSLA